MKRITKVAVAGAVGMTGVLGAAVAAPAVAATVTGEATPAEVVSSRVTALQSALKGLVSDGTLTQEQADKVAGTLAEKMPHGRGHHRGFGLAGSPEDAAAALGISAEELRTALREGKTLKQIAESKGTAVGDLVDKLVAAGEKRLADGVSAGRLTQAQADEIRPTLRNRISRMVEEPLGRRGGSHGGRGGEEGGRPGGGMFGGGR